MKTSNEGLQLIRKYEGCKLKPYLCPAKFWTVGYGHVIGNGKEVPEKQLYTRGEIDELLRTDLARFEQGVRRYCPVPLTQFEFDSLVSFSFNLGLGVLQRSTLRRKLLRQDRQAAAKEILKYNKAGGQVLKGLTRRREAEYRMFTNTNAII
jgi:lysozyme